MPKPRGHLNIDKSIHSKALGISKLKGDTLTNVVEQCLEKYIKQNAKILQKAIDY